jgi:tRNA A37 methylthiotransferase MiaB
LVSKSACDTTDLKGEWMFSDKSGNASYNQDEPAGHARHSVPSGELVLCNPPPYGTQPWLSSGVVLHYGLLSEAGVCARVVRPAAPPFDTPAAVFEATVRTFLFNPSIASRMETMASIYSGDPGYFDAMVDELSKGGEKVYGLCAFRNNVDVVLWLARLLKDREPDSFIIIGGPEAVEDPPELCLPWVDAVVGAKAEAVIVPLVERVLSGRPEGAGNLPNVWLHAKYCRDDSDPARRELLPTPAYPRIDYAPLVPLLVGDAEPAMPFLLNWGCPHHCDFCTTRNTYGDFSRGSVERVISEMDVVMQTWKSLHAGSPVPPMHLQLSDNTTNAIPNQFDELMCGIARLRSGWGRAHVRGQFLVDARITTERLRLMRDANFDLTFFGLETASDEFRRRLGKPGRIAEVAEAMKTIHRFGPGAIRMNFGIPVGIPGETDADFEETLRFVDWAMQFHESIVSVTILPYIFFLTTHESMFNMNNAGERRGLLWKMDCPGGDPSVRARRYMRVFETIDRRVEATSPVPPCVALPAMLPGAEAEELETWLSRYGRKFDELTPGPLVDLAIPESEDPMVSMLWAIIGSRFRTGNMLEGWALEGFGVLSKGGSESMIVLLHREADETFFALGFDSPDREIAAFAHHPLFNLKYLESWKGVECIYNECLMAFCMRLVEDISLKPQHPSSGSESIMAGL